MKRFWGIVLLILSLICLGVGCGRKETVPTPTTVETAPAAAETAQSSVVTASLSATEEKGADGEAGAVSAVKEKEPDDRADEAEQAEQAVSPDKETNKADSVNKIRFIISSDYGAKILTDKAVEYQQGLSVMEGLLSLGGEVQTSDGGGFISGIGDLQSGYGGISGERTDWFYYVDGIFADVGALDYYPGKGEVIWWDYHSWKMSQGIPAVTGCYPEPFLHGYGGKTADTTIMFFPENKKEAAKLRQNLLDKGVKDVNLLNIDPALLSHRKGPVIVLGIWERVQDVFFLKELNEAGKRAGLFAKFTGKSLQLLDYRFNKAEEFTENVGLIAATGEGSGDESPLWLIVGIDQNGLEAALQLLLDTPEKMAASFGMAVHEQELFKLPVMRK